jgi:mono/diheme cytochrome c family protein
VAASMRSGRSAVALLEACALGMVWGGCSPEIDGPRGGAGAPAPVAPSAAPAAGVAAPSTATPIAMGGQAGQMAPGFPMAPITTPPAQQPPVGTQSGTDAFCAALNVVQSNCQNCHGSTLVAGAPMSLVTFDDFMKPAPSDPARKVHQLVGERVHDLKRPMPPQGVLSQDKLGGLDAWLRAGVPQPTAACPVSELPAMPPGTQATNAAWPPADCEDVYKILAHDLMDPSKPYTIAANVEEHPQFTFDAPWGDDDVQLLATRPITDKPLVHHWILWASGERMNLTFWAPGAGGDVLPPDVGLYMPKGPASLGLDMHYNNTLGAQTVQDQSGVELCITRKFRPKSAAIYGLRGNASVAAMQRAENAVPCTVTTTSDVHFLGITPHMHKLGVHARLELKRGSAPVSVLYDGAYNFEEQTLKPLPDIQILNGDVLTTTCTYENTTDRDVAWGDSTEDEMCFNWMRYYPKGGFTCQPPQTNNGGRQMPSVPGVPQLPAP